MRRLVDSERLWAFIRALGPQARKPSRLYFTGGATAVLLGWRSSTIDIDIRLIPELDEVLRAIPMLKEHLEINVESAAPSDFIPELTGWRERCLFVAAEGMISYYHYDLYSQALAKVERGHDQDLRDVREMIDRGLIDPRKALDLFADIEPRLYRYPALDGASFRADVEKIFCR